MCTAAKLPWGQTCLCTWCLNMWGESISFGSSVMGHSEQHMHAHTHFMHCMLLTYTPSLISATKAYVLLTPHTPIIKKRLTEIQHTIHCMLLNIHVELCSPAEKMFGFFCKLRTWNPSCSFGVFRRSYNPQQLQREHCVFDQDTDSNPQVTIAAFMSVCTWSAHASLWSHTPRNWNQMGFQGFSERRLSAAWDCPWI